MIYVVVVTSVILVASMLVALARLVTAKDDASVAAVSDLVYFCAVGLLVLGGMAVSSSVVLDVAVLASLIGILATVSLARILTRGRR